MIADEELAAGEPGDFLERVEVGHLFVDLLRIEFRLLSRLAQSEGIDRNGHAFEALRELFAGEMRGVIDAVAEQNDRAGRILAEARALRDRGERIEECRLAERLQADQAAADRADVARERNDFMRFLVVEDVEREIVAGLAVRN